MHPCLLKEFGSKYIWMLVLIRWRLEYTMGSKLLWCNCLRIYETLRFHEIFLDFWKLKMEGITSEISALWEFKYDFKKVLAPLWETVPLRAISQTPIWNLFIIWLKARRGVCLLPTPWESHRPRWGIFRSCFNSEMYPWEKISCDLCAPSTLPGWNRVKK